MASAHRVVIVGGGFGGLYAARRLGRSEEHTCELQSLRHIVCRLLLEKKKTEARAKQALQVSSCQRATPQTRWPLRRQLAAQRLAARERGRRVRQMGIDFFF